MIGDIIDYADPLNLNYAKGERFFMKSGFTRGIAAILLCAALCAGVTACDDDDEVVSPTDIGAVSSQTEEKQLSELETLVQEDEFQEQVKALSQTYESKGIKLEVVAEGDSVVYKCIYTVKIDQTKSKEELSEHLESKAFETSIESVLRSFKAQVPQTRSVIVRYIDIDGNIVASKEYK